MRLRNPQNLSRQVSRPSGKPVKKPVPWGNYLYLLVLAVALFVSGRWGLKKFYRVHAPGVLSGAETRVESPIKSQVSTISCAIGDRVREDTPLVVLYDIDLESRIARQRADLERLQAEEVREKHRQAAYLEKEKSRVAILQAQTRRKREDVLGRIEVLRLKAKKQQEKLKQVDGLFKQTEKLYQLEAVTLPQFLDAKLALQENEAELAALTSELRTAKKNLVHLEDELAMLDQKNRNISGAVQSESTLPVLAVEIKSAQEQLALMEQSLQELTLRAPLSGVVCQLYKKAGEIVMPGEPILSIVDPGSLFVKVFFSQDEEKYLGEEEEVDLFFDNGFKTIGTINKIYPATGSLPPEFQEHFQPRRRAIIAEILPAGSTTNWPLTLGLEVEVQKERL